MVLHFHQKNPKGDGFIVKCIFKRLAGAAGLALGVAFTAASFFILQNNRRGLAALQERVEDLEYDRLAEAYRQAGYEMN